MSYLICEGCRGITDFPKDYSKKDSVIRREFLCECGCNLTMDHSYPSIASQDFVFTSQEIYERSKECDRENLNKFHLLLKSESELEIDKSDLDAHLNQYEKICKKYEDNEKKYFLIISDEFEEYLIKKMPFEEALGILSGVRRSNKNRFRKPFVIMVASLIEQLFNDYFERLVKSKLSTFGAKEFLDNYSSAGVQKCINISDSFLEASLELKMNRHKQGFYQEWKELRNKRNAIIHRNDTYVTKVELSRFNKLIDESVKVFARLTSELPVQDKSAD